MPEKLPTPTESVKQLEARERERIERERQPRLFDLDEPDSPESDGKG
jgi:hypothetical protein